MLYPFVVSRHSLAASLSLIALAAAGPIFAQTGDPSPGQAVAQPADATVVEGDSPEQDHLHDRRIGSDGTIIVTAKGLRQFDLLAGTSVIEGAQLDANLDGQLGEVLASVPGVTASGFAPGASRPVLRGFSGERVKVLVDGIGAIDVSNTSADHAVSIDPLTAESIEVLRGPAVLLYGSQAIGGAVNVIDKRIPRRVPSEPVHIDAIVRADTVSDLREGGASLDVPMGGGFVGHVDGSWRNTDDLTVPGYLNALELRSALLAEADEEANEGHADEANDLRDAALARGILPNSGTETWTANGGIAFFRGDSNLGVSFGVYDTYYGVPIRPGTGHAHEEGSGEGDSHEAETVNIGLRQYRADMRGSLDMGEGFFDRLDTRVGYSDYTHTEFEGDEVGTTFDVQGIEARAELVQNPHGAWRGSLGTQYYFRDFLAQGAEAYIAPNRTEQLSAFALQEYGDGPFQVEGAVRYEKTRVDSVPLGLQRDFGAVSGVLGLAYESQGEDVLRAGVNLSRVARAPSAEELFSNGPHIATQAYEVGDPDLAIERAWGVEAFVRGQAGALDYSLAAYRNWFDNYIYLSETGDEEDSLPVFLHLQQDATYTGAEGEIGWTFLDTGSTTFHTDLRGEYVRAKLADGSNVPRIPPLSFTAALETAGNNWKLRGEVEHAAAQNDVAAYETTTDGFTMVNAIATWKPLASDPSLSVILKAENIFDATGRRHTSFTKDFVPMAGRNISVTARMSL